MATTRVTMPQLGESVTEGTVDRWLKKEGDYVKRDELIVEVVTDKVNAEIPSPFEGTLVRISVPEGTTIPIGTEIGVSDWVRIDQGTIEGFADLTGDHAFIHVDPERARR